MRTLEKVANLNLRTAPDGRGVPHSPPQRDSIAPYELNSNGEVRGPVSRITPDRDTHLAIRPSVPHKSR